MEAALLKDLGLAPGEIKVYVALLSLGKTSIGKLTSKSKVSRSKVYDILERLIDKGLVSEVMEDGTKMFSPLDPRKLYRLVNDKEQRLAEIKKALKKDMNQFLEAFNQKEQVRISVYRGYEGLKNIFSDVITTLKEKETLYVFTAIPTPSKAPDNYYYFLRQFNKQRIEKKIALRLIANKTEKQSILKDMLLEDKTKLTQLKISPENFYTPAVFNIYKNKTAIVIWSETPITVLVESKEAAKGFMKYFELLWSISNYYDVK